MAIVATHVAAVQELYVAYFGRPADAAGLDYWTNIVEAQGSTTAVSATFAASPEYTAAFAGMNNTQIVNQIYLNLFGRAADTAGRDYWVGLLNAGTIGVNTIVAEVAAAALTTDAEAVENKVAAATAFTNALDTTAEQNGYAGPAALALAKAFITGVTTDATLSAAIAPAALNATVAAVVNAGTPFTLVSGLAALDAANGAVTDFLASLDLDDDEDTDTEASDVFEALYGTDGVAGATPTVGTNGAIFDVDAEIGGTIDFATASPTVRAALIADRTAALNTQLTAAQTALAEDQADVDEVVGLSAAVASLETATTAVEAANSAEDEALAIQTAAVAAFEVRTGATAGSVTVNADGTVAGFIVENPTTGALQLATGLTAAQRTAANQLLTDIVAYQEALADQTAAVEAQFAAQLEVNLLDEGTATETNALTALVAELNEADVGAIVDDMPTAAQILNQRAILEESGTPADLLAFENALTAYMNANETAANNPLSSAVIAQAGVVAGLEGDIEDLAEAVAALEVAQANYDELTSLNEAVADARAAFSTNGFRPPVVLDEVTAGATLNAAGTAGSDIFVVGDSMTTNISSFGRVGSDSLYIGTEYTLNTGAITAGDNSVLEVFFINNSTGGVQVRLETEVYGSDNAAVAEQIITLTGVQAEDLQFVDGIISLRAPTA
ncbi:hypothetical protein ABIB42_003018 [Massilia sp. UYP32]|uniref:DUF4214 domain-containing protein n=1 Tax=Massilia sp. UYP32 TaxID=1756386 RepID=UPI000D9A7526